MAACFRPESGDGPVVQRMKEILSRGLPVELGAQVIDFPTRQQKRLPVHGYNTLKPLDPLLDGTRRAGAKRPQRRTQPQRRKGAVKHLSDLLLRCAHGRTLSRWLRKVKGWGE